MTSILVVEDDPLMAEAIKLQLVDCGYQVAAMVSQGEVVVEQAQALGPDLVLMDIMLAGKMDGIEAAQKIRDSCDIPVLYLTAYADDEFFRRAKVTEPYAYLLKPSSQREIQLAIEIALCRHKTERTARAVLENAVAVRTAKLEKARRRIASILESISDAFISLDKDWCYTYVNAKAGELFGCKPEDLVGKHIWTEFPESVGQPFFDAYHKAMAEQTPIELEAYYPSWGRWFENRIYPSTNHICIFFHGITESNRAEQTLQQSEHDLRQAQAIAHIGSWNYDMAGQLTWSDELYRIYGVSRETFTPNVETFLNLIHPDDRAAMQAWINVCTSGQKLEALEFRCVWPDGTIHYINGQGELILDADGKPDHMAGTGQDITARKQAENALRDSEARYRTMFQSNPHPMWVYDMETLRFLAVNDAAVVHYGYSLEQFLSMTIKDIRPPEDVPRLLETIAHLARTGLNHSGIWRHLKQDGTVIDVEITSHGLNFDGRNARLVMVHDITERKKAEEKLSASVARFRAITETTTYAIITADIKGNIVEWNEGAESTFGYARAEALGLPLTELMPQRFRDRHTNGLSRARSGNKVAGKTVEFYGLSKAENEFPLEMTLSEWSTAEGRFFTAIMRDITARKRAEESLHKLSQAVEQSPSSIVIADLDANIEYVNEGFIKTTGYSFAEAVGQNPRLLQSGKTARAIYDDMWSHLTRGEEWKGELINRRKDGREYVELVMISPVRQSDGGVTHYLAVMEDITQRKRVEMQLAEKLDELRRWYDATMGREMRVLELKREVNELLGQIGQPPRYFNAEAVKSTS